MLLAIDVGNTSTSFGLFDGKRLKKRWSVDTESVGPRHAGVPCRKIGQPQGLSLHCIPLDIGQVIISSVVPKADIVLKKIFPTAKFIKARDIKDLKIRIKNINEVGADRAVNAYAVKKLYGCPAIVVDFGTATTFDVVSKNGEYLGGAIVPGIQMSADALHEKTAKLPKITVKRPKKLIGDSTIEAMRSGMFYGYISLVEGMIARFRNELTPFPPLLLREGVARRGGVSCKVVATGGYAKFIAKYASGIDIIDQDLTLKGLNIL